MEKSTNNISLKQILSEATSLKMGELSLSIEDDKDAYTLYKLENTYRKKHIFLTSEDIKKIYDFMNRTAK